MAYLNASNRDRIEKASVEDLRRLFAEDEIIQIELGDGKHQVNAAVASPTTAMVTFADLKRAKAFMPAVRPDREQALRILERFLSHGDRDPSIEWKPALIPFIPGERSGCLGVSIHAAMFYFFTAVWLIAMLGFLF